MPTEVLYDAVRVIWTHLQSQIILIPGMNIVADYVKSSYQNDPFRVGLEALLIFFTLRYLLSRPKQNDIELTSKEIDDLVDEWEPEPMVSKNAGQEATVSIIDFTGPIVKTADGKELLNLVSSNYLGLHNTERIKDVAIDTVKKYGVGTCGPAGFYGTLDVHLKLEKELARILGTESAIIYAQGFAALGSVIPAFSKRGDIIVADEQVNLAIQKGMTISRSRIYYFKHNDMEDLERVLEEINLEDAKKNRVLTRRFIVVEGLYSKTGHIAKLRNLVEIKDRFKYRLIVDETNSFGALGPRGLGVGDYFDIPNTDLDIIVGMLSSVLGSAGGFCAGSEAVIDHQRLSSQAYCFSASLPAVLAYCALENLLEIEAKPDLALYLKQAVKDFRSRLESKIEDKCRAFEVSGHQDSPLMFLRLKNGLSSREAELEYLQRICKTAIKKGILISCPATIVGEERLLPRPSIKITVQSTLTSSQIDQAIDALTKSITETAM